MDGGLDGKIEVANGWLAQRCMQQEQEQERRERCGERDGGASSEEKETRVHEERCYTEPARWTGVGNGP